MSRTEILEAAVNIYYKNLRDARNESIKESNNLMEWLLTAQRELNELMGARS